MSTQVLNNWYLLFNGVDLTPYVRNLSPNFQQETGDDTAGSNVTAREFAPTIKNGTMAITLNLELGAGAVEATLWAAWDANAAFSASYAADGSTPAAANPVYTQSFILTQWTPFQGDVGTKGEVTVASRDITP
jgi:hypothetical protein